jgi:predicted RNA-binding Zn-ribbon protein involved in translation (DUF1610 family)
MTNQQCPNCGAYMVERDEMLYTCPKCGDNLDLRYGVEPPFDVVESDEGSLWEQVLTKWAYPKDE